MLFDRNVEATDVIDNLLKKLVVLEKEKAVMQIQLEKNQLLMDKLEKYLDTTAPNIIDKFKEDMNNGDF